MAPSKKAVPKITVEKKATVISKATHEKVVAEKDALIKEKKSEITTAKKDALDWEQRALAAEKTADDLGKKLGAVETKGFKWALKKVWPLLAFIIVILGVIVWAMAVHIGKDTARENKAVQPYKDSVQGLRQQVDYYRTGANYDSLHTANFHIPAPVDEKKNSSRKMK